MRVLYLSNAVIPSRFANSIQIMRMCEAMGENHDVALVARRAGGANIWRFYGCGRTFRIVRIRSPKLRGAWRWFEWRMKQIVRRWKPDVVYGRYLPGVLYAAERGIKTVYEVHVPPSYRAGKYPEMVRQLVRVENPPKIIAISRALAHDYAGESNFGKPIQVLPCAARFTPNVAQPKSAKLRVGYFGSLATDRGMPFIERLAQHCPWAHVEIISDLEPWQVEDALQPFDVLLAPYMPEIPTARWMSPMKIFEYMAAGKAIIATDLPAIREILAHERTALLCEPNIADWIAALERLRDDETLRLRLGREAGQKQHAEHTWHVRAEVALQGL